jgi:hypothetical protein
MSFPHNRLPNNSCKPITNTAWVRVRFCKLQIGCTRREAASDKVYQLFAHGRWFTPGSSVSSTTKTGRHDIVEILLKAALNTINQIKSQQTNWLFRTIFVFYFLLVIQVDVITPPKDITCIEGEDPMFYCEVAASKSEATWYKNGQEVTSDHVQIESKKTTHTLSIPQATRDDSGSYTMEIGDERREAYLNVEGKYLFFKHCYTYCTFLAAIKHLIFYLVYHHSICATNIE